MARRAVLFLALVFALQSPIAGRGPLRIYFVDIGQGAATLIVPPTGGAMLVDGGPPNQGTNKLIPLLRALDINRIEHIVLTHYHIDHDEGLTEVINDHSIAIGHAWDNGDGDDVIPPPGGSYNAYLRYVRALEARPDTERHTVSPGESVSLGPARATFLVAGGRLLSGARAVTSTIDLNTTSVGVLVEYGTFDFIVAGDLTGGGSTSTANTPDVETWVGQMVGDVDVVQLDHHGSTTASSARYLAALKAEVGVAQASYTNTFGHPNRETGSKYLTTAVSDGHTYEEEDRPAPGYGPVLYQSDPSRDDDDRVTRQAYTVPPVDVGRGTLLLMTDGDSWYSIMSFEDGGVVIDPAKHSYTVDGISPGVTTDFAPTVMPSTDPAVPDANNVVVVRAHVADRESPIQGVTLRYAIDGVNQTPIPMTPQGGGFYAGRIRGQPNGTRVEYTVVGTAGTKTTEYSSGYFAGVTSITALRTLTRLGEPRYAGYTARVQGAVTAGSGTFGSGTNDDYVQDATGGLNVFRTIQPANPPFVPIGLGQIVEIAGVIGFVGGKFRLEVSPPFASPTTPYTISIIDNGPAPEPVIVTLADIAANPEGYEGLLVAVKNCYVVSGEIPPAGAPLDGFLVISDDTAELGLKIDHDTDIPGLETPTDPFTLVGVVQQDDFVRPFDSGYNIAPRDRRDLDAPDAALTIADVRVDDPQDFVPDRLGERIKSRGVVTTVDFRDGPGVEFYIQDPTAGINLFRSNVNFGPFEIGESVEVVGDVEQFNGQTRIGPGTTLTNIRRLPPGTLPPVTPQNVTLFQLRNIAGEAFEGLLVRIANVRITSGQFPPEGMNGNVTINDGTWSLTMRIMNGTDIDGTETPTGTFTLTAVVGQFDTTPPYDSFYQVLPRMLSDIEP